MKIIWILTGERVPTLSGDPGEVSVVQLLIHVAEVILVASHRSLDTKRLRREAEKTCRTFSMKATKEMELLESLFFHS